MVSSVDTYSCLPYLCHWKSIVGTSNFLCNLETGIVYLVWGWGGVGLGEFGDGRNTNI